MNIDSEAKLEKYTKKKLEALGCLVYKFTSPAKRGVPDALVIQPNGKIFFIEFKNPKGTGKLSKLQEIEVHKMQLNLATVWVVGTVRQADGVIQIVEDSVQIVEDSVKC